MRITESQLRRIIRKELAESNNQSNGLRYDDYLQAWWDEIENAISKLLSDTSWWAEFSVLVKNIDRRVWKIKDPDIQIFEIDVKPDFQRGNISLIGHSAFDKQKNKRIINVALNAKPVDIAKAVMELIDRLSHSKS